MTQEEHGWKSKEAVQHYARVADALVPGRLEVLSIIAGLATAAANGPLKVLDLGCGYGAVTAEILNLRPDASACLVDFSDEMIRLSTERFDGNPGISVINHDLNLGLPEAVRSQHFGAVVSCYALHHLEFEHRASLYLQITGVLQEGALFVNGDRFRQESPFVDDWVFRGWMSWTATQIREKFDQERTTEELAQRQRESDQRLGDKPGTVWEMERDLRQAGFRYVDCVWKRGVVAVVVATR